jgi:hypothetical protein
MQSTVEKLRRAVEILQSAKVASVQVIFDYITDEGVRHYTVKTSNGLSIHTYRLWVSENSEGDRFLRCNCAAAANKMLCRHAIKVAEVDSNKYGIPLFYEGVAEYQSHVKRLAETV